MLGVVVTETLYVTHPDLSEGRLAKLRAAVVNARALAEVGRGIRLGEHVKLGRGEETTGGRNKASILSDTVEAVIGAVHLSGGIEVSSEVVHRLFDPLIEAASALGAGLDIRQGVLRVRRAVPREQVKGDKRGRNLPGQLADPALRRVEPRLHRVEVEDAVPRDHDLAVDRRALRQEVAERRELGEVAEQRARVSRPQPELARGVLE